jgi:hypothetical protein
VEIAGSRLAPFAVDHARWQAWAVWLGWGSLLALLVGALPLFLRMPLTPDVYFYDVCARNVLQGGVHYREVFDTNLPGMVWLHMAVRTLLGWQPEAIRCVAFVVVGLVIASLVRWWLPLGGAAARVWTAVLLWAFYFSTSELCHCQRDVWMLLPALTAARLRFLQAMDLREGLAIGWRSAILSVLEGACWAAAFWIKPFVVVPALGCWLVSIVWVLRSSGQNRWSLATSAAGVLTGAFIVLELGIAWLERTGAWDSFLNVFLVWNREYGPHAPILERFTHLFLMWPWGLVHLFAFPLAIRSAWRAVSRDSSAAQEGRQPALAGCLLCGLYVGWVFQAWFLQWGYEYQQVPALLLALAIVCGRLAEGPVRSGFTFACIALVSLAVLNHPLLRSQRTQLWVRCLSEPASAELWDRLALTDYVTWSDLHRVRQFLHGQELRDGELTCMDFRTESLYADLSLRPSTRFLSVSFALDRFACQRGTVLQELAGSRQRLIVSDLQKAGLTPSEENAVGPGGPLSYPPAFDSALLSCYPWCEPVVFRSGRYLVHRAVTELSQGSHPMAIAAPPPSFWHRFRRAWSKFSRHSG